MLIKAATAFSTIILLTACTGGSSTGSSQLSFAGLEDLSDDLYDANRADLIANDFTPLNELPMTGSARHEGVIGISYGAGRSSVSSPVLIGEIATRLDFKTGDFDGTADNFYVVENGSGVSGTLEIDAELDRTVNLAFEYGIEGTISGVLENENVTVRHDVPFQADAYGANGGVLFGVATGTSTDQEGEEFITEVSYLLESSDS